MTSMIPILLQRNFGILIFFNFKNFSTLKNDFIFAKTVDFKLIFLIDKIKYFFKLIFSQILGELTDAKLTNQEKIESGERFEFIAITDSWKNQRRKRRQQIREQQKSDASADDEADSETPAKRIRLDEIQKEDRVEDVIKSRDSIPLLHIEISVESKTISELQAIVEVKLTYLNGTAGLNGVYELLQFIQNKW